MSRLAYLEGLSRADDEYQHKQYSNLQTKTPVLTKQYAVKKDTPEVDWKKVAFNTYLALNPYVHPVARLNAGLNVAQELQFIDSTPLDAIDALEKLDLI